MGNNFRRIRIENSFQNEVYLLCNFSLKKKKQTNKKQLIEQKSALKSEITTDSVSTLTWNVSDTCSWFWTFQSLIQLYSLFHVDILYKRKEPSFINLSVENYKIAQAYLPLLLVSFLTAKDTWNFLPTQYLWIF